MFSKLYQIVKSNALTLITENNIVPLKFKDAAINEASGTIVDVLKSQMESGKFKDVLRFFQTSGIDNNALINIGINKYANRLNRHYNINIDAAKEISVALIPPAMKQFVASTETSETKESAMFSVLNWLSGNTINFEKMLSRMNTLQIA
ncbi:MAG: hypothetical protein EAY66_09540 [Sphingobacteriales bacterium]|nr:MAG: hypothetical protein EAY66_09540 [Sphingobacteriales bacterium]